MRKRALEVAEPLLFGTMIHSALQFYWTGRKLGWTPEEILKTLLVPKSTGSFDLYTQQKAIAMLATYMALWDLVECEVLAVEVQFRLPLTDPETGEVSEDWELGGKIDAIIRLADGRVAILEHKTTSDEAKPGGAYRMRLEMDGQISQYFRGARALDYPADLLFYDVLRKPKQKPLLATPIELRKYKVGTGELYKNQREKDETPEEYGARVTQTISEEPEDFIIRLEIERTERQERFYGFDVWQYAEQMKRSEVTGIAPGNPDHCVRYNWPCEFFGVCTEKWSIFDPSKYRTLKDPNEELSAE